MADDATVYRTYFGRTEPVVEDKTYIDGSHRPRAIVSDSTYTSAAAELVREALRDATVREEIKAIFLEDDQPDLANEVEMIEPLIDAREVGKILGMSAAAVRAAAFRKTIPSLHVGRLLRFRRSEVTSTVRR
jgi:predicted DNA-binding transcriptional regulator AlpA